MTAPTHIIFSVVCSSLGNADYWSTAACAFGSILPDLDHPKSALGRVLFFISQPLNKLAGHRGIVHSFFVYFPLLLLGMLLESPRLQWLAIGAISHIVADCYNTSGVRAFAPFSQKTVVLFKRDWRVGAGSLGEIYAFIAFAALLPATHFSNAIGGPRRLINHLIRSPKITAEEFERAGVQRCFAEGEFRWSDGRIESVKWLIVGNESADIVFFDGNKLIRTKHGAFLRSRLMLSGAAWQSVRLQGIGTTDAPAFFFDGKAWYYTPGGKVFGIVRTVDNAMPEIRLAAAPRIFAFGE